jgi:Uncharacterised nucleotidyltransferase
MSNPWPHASNLPAGPRAALAALHLSDPRAPKDLSDSDWREALEFCNRSQITLALRQRVHQAMPPWVREITDWNLAHNLQRLRVTEELYRSIAQRLRSAGIEFLALKGLTQCPLFGSEPRDRPQYDIDLFTPEAVRARAALLALGFESIEGMERFPTGHLPALIRKTGWEYRGDVFDPEMPLAVELHFQLWDGDLERLPAPGLEEFWERRVIRQPLGLPALATPDALAYAGLHLLKHLLRSSARPFHAYEIACFLNSHAADERFWAEWRSLHSPTLRRLQAVAFRFAWEWFGCALGPARDEIAQLQPAVAAWFDRFALSPVSAPFDFNKHELWLHLSLVASRRDALSVARRRLFPGRLPPAVDAVYVPSAHMGWRRRALRQLRWTAYAASRFWRHTAALPGVARSGVLWWWHTRGHGTI